MSDRNARQRRYSRRVQSEAAEIGEIPKVVNPRRRRSCKTDLLKFLVTYFPNSTGLKPFSEDHRRAIGRIQQCVLAGGRFAQAFPRGFAKTTVSENSALWAVLYGHRRFVPIFGADANAADGNIDSIKLELSENDLLYEDFPEVCHAIRALEGKAQRCASQTHKSELTHIQWTADQIVMPTIPKSAASGAILAARGIMGGSRGMKHKRPDGTQQRPDFVILDDPQTDESASTPLQVNKRLNVIRKSILKLGGHQRSIAVVVNATVIRKDDMVDQLLDHKRNPSWQSERIKMVKAWATKHEDLWLGRYTEVRNTYNPDDPDDQRRAHRAATDFYRANREAMDAGCVISWEHCYDSELEISAIQHAYNALIDDGPEVFASEFQNEPIAEDQPATDELTPLQICGKLNNLPRGLVPLGCEHVTAHIDVQGKALYWQVCAWASRFDGYVVDYGTYPDQGKKHFSLREVKRTLAMAAKGAGLEGAIYAGLETLADQLLGREWKREDGAAMHVGMCIVDANWGVSTDTVYQFCRQTKFPGRVMPGHGRFIGATSTPMHDYRKKPGERVGLNWRMPPIAGKRAVRHVVYDTNAWKSFLTERLATAMGDRGCLSLFGKDPEEHRMLADHLTAEYPVSVQAKGRTVAEFKLRPNRDNHYLDNLVGCAVAASMLGCSLVGAGEGIVRVKKRVRFSDLQKGRRL